MMKFLFVLLVCVIGQHDAYKILLYSPLFGHSHTQFLGKLADTLTNAGHNVTVLMPVIETYLLPKTGLKTTKNLIMLDATLPEEKEEITKDVFAVDVWTMKTDVLSFFSMWTKLEHFFEYSCNVVVSNDTLLEQLRAEKFDLGLSETFHFCGFGLFEVLQIPSTVGALSTIHMEHVSEAIGEPHSPSYVPAFWTTSFDVKMTIFEKISNVFAGFVSAHIFNAIFDSEHQVFLNKYGPNFRSRQDIVSDINYHFANANPYLNYPKPTIHKVVEIGSITVDDITKKTTKLDEKWDKIFDERKQTVLVSFGSIAKSMYMPPHFKDNLLTVFASMPDVTFIWKYEEDSNMADHLPNVHLCKWTPQIALLNDPRLNLFITHGGLASTTELSHLGKPALFIPLFAEQPRNAAMLSRHGGSTYLFKEDLNNPKKLRDTIRLVLSDSSYLRNARKLADLLNNQPIDMTEKFVKHVEFAAKFGRISNLDPYGRQLSLIEYYLVDVVLFVFASVVIVLAAFVWVLRFVNRKYWKGERMEKSKKVQ